MKLIHLSDTHGKHKYLTIPDGDLIIHSGDATNLGTEQEIRMFFQWFGSLPHKHKIFIPGNHDIGFERDFTYFKRIALDSSASDIKIETRGFISVENINIFCYSYSVKFGNWAFMKRDSDIDDDLERFRSEKIDIFVTHSPPYSILDQNSNDTHCGTMAIERFVKNVKPRFHLFGHIHESYGVRESMIQDGLIYRSITYVNSALCSFNNKVRKPQEFEI